MTAAARASEAMLAEIRRQGAPPGSASALSFANTKAQPAPQNESRCLCIPPSTSGLAARAGW